MPRAKTSSPGNKVAVKAVKEVPKHPGSIFPYIVHEAIKAKLIVDPNDPKYDEKKDKLRIGYQFGGVNVPIWMPMGVRKDEVSAYDFLTNPKDDKRPGQSLTPQGCGYTSLEHGISDYSELPPIFIWRMGRWLSEIIDEEEFDLGVLPNWVRLKVDNCLLSWPKSGVPDSLFTLYLTPGEGTPGNNVYRLFELPRKVCNATAPHHPQMWPVEIKTKKLTTPYTGYKSPATSTTSSSSTFTPPSGTRVRCPECGHWFTYTDLITHSSMCGDPEKQDWAIMCHGDCGCHTLDQASTPKTGFPRPVIGKKKEVEKVENDDGGDGVPEEASQ